MTITPRLRLILIAGALGLAVLLMIRFTPTNNHAGTAISVGSSSAGSAVGGVAVQASTGSVAATSSAAATSSSTAAAPAVTAGGDGGDDGTDDTPPVLVQPTEQPDAKEASAQFTAAWLNTQGKSPETWRASLADRITDELAAELVEADPDSVPAAAKAAQVDVTVQGSLYGAQVQVITNDTARQPVGQLTLTLVQRDGVWLVSQIDWEPRR